MTDFTLPRETSSGPDGPGSAVLRLAQDFVGRRWRVIGLTLLAVLVVTGIVLHAVAPHYVAEAEILLDPRRQKAFGPDDTLHLISLDASDIESAIVMIKANALLGRVVAAEHLSLDPEFATPQEPSLLAHWLSRDAHAFPASTTALGHQAIATLSRHLKVERISKAYALAISVTADRPEKAARLANAVADAFVRDQRDAHLESSRLAAAFFAERLAPLGEQLHRSEEALEGFRREHDLIARTASSQAGSAAPTLNEQQVAELNTRLAAAKGETAQAEARYEQARAVQAKGGLIETLPDVVRSNVIAQLRQQQAEVARKEADLAARYTEGYPLLINARAERREIERAIAREMARVLANLKGVYDIARAQEDSLRASVAASTGAAGLDSDLGPRLRELERVRLVDQTMFETYLAKAKAAEQQSTFDEQDVRVISPADAALVRSYPQTQLVLICMTMFGLSLGVGLGWALDTLDPGFITPNHTEEALGLPVLAAVPWLRPRELVIEGKALDPLRYLAERPHSRYAEAVHAIRAGIRTSGGEPAKVVLVTSSVPGEGKSMLAFSLALSAARAGQRVLLLDADLRGPALSRYFGFEHRLGLVDMLSGLVGTAETTVPLGSGLSLMPSGRRSAAAPDLFASARMAIYIDHLRGIYDLVVIDAAPAGAVVDAKVLAGLSDRILFVVGWRQTARDLVARNLRMLGHPQKIAGVVLNKIDERMTPLHRGNAHGGLAYDRGAEA